MVKVLDYGIVVNEFELQSCYYVNFRTNILGKGQEVDDIPPKLLMTQTTQWVYRLLQIHLLNPNLSNIARGKQLDELVSTRTQIKQSNVF